MTRGDEPINGPDEDVFDRARMAVAIACEIRRIDVFQGAVVGVLGPWGSGKTSLINLIRKELGKPPAVTVLDFNPWLFSGADQLVESFFIELSAQLRLKPGKLEVIANEFERYGEVVAPLRALPVVGTWIDAVRGAGQAFGKLHVSRRKGVAETRKRLADKLGDLNAPIIVVVDDVDRLSAAEIRDVFKLVRLTANFPNVLYLVAFDRARIERALAEDGLPGRDYLEKIIQAAYDIPEVPAALLVRQITLAMDEALEGLVDPGPFQEDRWPDIFAEVIRPLFRTMRDVRRYAASLRGTVQSLEGKIALVDVLGLEAVRVFLPDLFAAVARCREELTDPWRETFFNEREEQQRAESIKTLVAVPTGNRDVATALIRRLFPAALRHIENHRYGLESLREWQRERRVAHPDVLEYYLERVAGTSLQAFWGAEAAVQLLTDREEFDAYMRALDPAVREDTIGALEAYEGEFPVEAAEPASIVLLNLQPEIPERARGMFDFGSQLVVERVVLRLLRRLPTPEDVSRLVRSALPEIRTLSGRRTLLGLVGHDENAGHQLIDHGTSLELEASLRGEIRAANPEALAAEPELFRLLSWAKRTTEASEPRLELPTGTVLDCALLKGAVSEERSRYLGTRAVRAEKVLLWDGLVDLVGGEDAVRRIVDACREGDDPALIEAIELAEKYLNGWRPGRS